MVPLRWALQTERRLVLILDYMPGGELFFHLRVREEGEEEEEERSEGMGWADRMTCLDESMGQRRRRRRRRERRERRRWEGGS